MKLFKNGVRQQYQKKLFEIDFLLRIHGTPVKTLFGKTRNNTEQIEQLKEELKTMIKNK